MGITQLGWDGFSIDIIYPIFYKVHSIKKGTHALGNGRSFETKRQLAIEGLMDAILRGEYRPGQRLLQDQLAKRFGLSATPVREALTQLDALGIVVHESHKGARVAKLNLSDLEELYAVRALLESYAAELCVKNLTARDIGKLERLQARIEYALKKGDHRSLRDADAEFHMTLYRAAQNTRLLNLVCQLWSAFPRYLIWLIPGRAEKSAIEHRRILALIQERDAEGTAREVRYNLESCLHDLLVYVRSGKAPPFLQQKEQNGSTRTA